jgi:single-strand DNA-binding protein
MRVPVSAHLFLALTTWLATFDTGLSFALSTSSERIRLVYSAPWNCRSLKGFSWATLLMFDENEELVDEDELTDEELAATVGEWDEKIARFNTIHVTGRVGSNPEPRYFDDGKVVVNISLACKRKYHTAERKHLNLRSGEEETDWYGLEIWGQTAEFVSKFVDKGARVGVVGSLQIDEWNDKSTGELRSRPKVVVRDFDILETKAEADLRRSNKRGPAFSKDDGEDEWPSSAGTGGFFDS